MIAEAAEGQTVKRRADRQSTPKERLNKA